MKIVISCCGGNTSNILAAKLRKYLIEEKRDLKVKACAEINIEKHLEISDILLVAPQNYLSAERIEVLKHEYGITVLYLSYEIYGELDAKKTYELIFKESEPKQPLLHEQKHFITRLVAFNNMRGFKNLQRAFRGLFKPMIIGTVATLIMSFPLGATYKEFIALPLINNILSLLILLTIHSSSIYLVFSWGFSFEDYSKKTHYMLGLACLISFLFTMPANCFQNYAYYFGIQSVFAALIIAIFVTNTFRFMKRYVQNHAMSLNENAQYLLWLIGLFIILYGCKVIIMMNGFTSINDVIATLINMPLKELTGNWNIYLVYTFVSIALWFFGIHGGMVANTIFMGIYVQAIYGNVNAYSAGLSSPYPMYSLFLWTAMGGTGCTLALNLWMLQAKSKKLRDNGKKAILTSIFNMNEPIIFGAPIAYNMVLFVPFLIVPFINLAITYVSLFMLKIVSMPTGSIDSVGTFLPFGLNAFISTQSATGVLLSFGLLLIDMFIWYPFFKKYDESLIQLENKDCHNSTKL